MKTFVKITAGLVGLALVAAVGCFLWASGVTQDRFDRVFDVHGVEFPVPFPLTEQELATLRAQRMPEGSAAPDAGAGEPPDPLEGVDLDALALERAVARGRHLLESRYACVECHGENLGGGVMLDDPPLGRLLGPNITTGKGGKTADYSIGDWDRIIRHGVRPNDRPAFMPSEDFQLMSDQELSDIIAYLATVTPVDNEVPASSLGPLGTVLVALGEFPISAENVKDHDAEHPGFPPVTEVSWKFGEHLGGPCRGCHREGLNGGPMPFGPPDWPAAANLTPHEDGIKGWSYDDFVKLMREGVRPDGSSVQVPMSLMQPYAKRMTETEMKALWDYLSGLRPRAMGR